MKLTKKHKALINNRMKREEKWYNSLGYTCSIIENTLGLEQRNIYANFFNFADVGDNGIYNSSTVNEKYVYKLPKPERTQLRSLLLTVFMETYNDCI